MPRTSVSSTSKRKTRPATLKASKKKKSFKKGPTQISKSDTSSADRRINVQNRIRSTFTGTRIFDRSLHKTNTWLKELMVAMGWNHRERALSLFRATLHALRDVLPLQEVADLGAQFPILIRGLYYENWHVSSEPLKLNSMLEFYALVRENLGRGGGKFSGEELRQAVRASLEVVTKHVSAGQISDVKGSLRKNLKALIEPTFEELQEKSAKQDEKRQRANRRPSQRANQKSARTARKKLKRVEAKRSRKLDSGVSVPRGELLH